MMTYLVSLAPGNGNSWVHIVDFGRGQRHSLVVVFVLHHCFVSGLVQARRMVESALLCMTGVNSKHSYKKRSPYLQLQKLPHPLHDFL